MTKKKQDYFKVIQVIIKYRDEWLKELQDNIYIEQGNMRGLNEEIKEKLNIPVNLSKFLQKQLSTIFEALNHENDFIIESENEIAKVVLVRITEKFKVWLNHKIKSAFYNEEQFENFFEELVRHSLNSLRKTLTSNQMKTLFSFNTKLN